MSTRIYTEEEVAHLIRRAVELEAERTVSGDKDSIAGLSISELEKIAASSGIDPELIHQAAGEMNSGLSELNRNKHAQIKKSEIVCERWLQAEPDQKTLDFLITELNHRHGTSENDITWWDRLWDSYAGKAKIRKTANSVEWHYTDEWEYYTTRVLLQKRGSKFRIRVSKRQKWGLQWSYMENSYWFYMSVIFVLTIIGGVLTFSFFDNVWMGIAAGIALSAASYPFMKYFNNQSINKHRDEVSEIANDLTEMTIQLINEPEQNDIKITSQEEDSLREIEIGTDKSVNNTGSGSNRFRNNLRT